MVSEVSARKLSIDAAVARELKRRKLVVRYLWGLIVFAFILTVWIFYKGYNVVSFLEKEVRTNVPKATAEYIANEQEFIRKVSNQAADKINVDTVDKAVHKLSSDTNFVKATLNGLAHRSDIQEGISHYTARQLSQNEEFLFEISNSATKKILSNPELIETAAAELANNSAFVNSITESVSNGSSVQHSQKILSDALHKLQDRQLLLEEKMSSLELKLTDISQQLEAVKAANLPNQRNITDIAYLQMNLEESLNSGINNIEQKLQVLSGDLEALKKKRVELPRVFLLKTSQWNDLPAIDMKVKIGRMIGGEAVSEFALKKGSELCELKSEIKLGHKFLCAIGNYSYQIELTYVVNRLLFKDYIGMEILLVPSNQNRS